MPDSQNSPVDAPGDARSERGPHNTPEAATAPATQRDGASTAGPPLTEQQLADYEAAIGAYQQHPNLGFPCCPAHPAADAANALLAEVRRLNARVAELEEKRRLEWQTSHAANPHTPRLCKCGHSHFAHTVPAPHSCFAHGQTCPCEAYQQLPHDEAVAQLKRNQQAAAERAAPAETHIVADDSDDPEHVDDCPGCVPSA
jgi:hypothetical protein